jgi:hypothetical protein
MAIDSETKREAAAAARATKPVTTPASAPASVPKSVPKSTSKPKSTPNANVDKVVEGLQKGIAGLSKEEARLSESLKEEQERLKRVAAAGGGSTTLTDAQIRENERAYDREQADLAEAERKRRQGQSAYDVLLAEFNRYGLGTLLDDVKNLIITGADEASLTLALRQTKAYQNRFAANADRIKSGLRALSEAEYVTLEDQYQNVMRNYGLPATYYTKDATGKQAGFEKFIAGDVSATELEDRIAIAQKRVLDAPPQVKDALKQFYPDIKDADILAYTLDPTRGLADIQKKVLAAEIGGAAMGQGLATSASRAEELARFGVTAEAAREGFQTVADVAPRGSQLAAIYGQDAYGQAEAEQEVFGLAGSAEAGQRRKKLSELERSAFSGQAGTTAGALGRDRAGSF